MFTKVLYGFGMICMELTRTDIVFSKTTVVLFFVQKWKFYKWAKTFWRFFWNRRDPRSFLGGPQEPRGGHNPLGRAWALALAPVYCAHLEAHLDVRPSPKIPINRETIRNNPRSEVLPPQASVATENQSGPRSGPLPERGIISSGHLHHPGGHHNEEGLVHPRGWGFVPVVDTSILHHAFMSIFIALWAVITHYISILMAILSYFTRFTMKRGDAGSWNSGWKRSKRWKPILHNSKSPETPRNNDLDLIRIYERKK